MKRLEGLAIAFVLLGACTGSRPDIGTTGSPPPRGSAPDRVGDRAFCTLLAPIQATGRLYYSPRYPSAFLPRAQRCFVSVAQARAAGLLPAPPPPGSRLLAGIYLVPTGQTLLQTCERSARTLGYAVACPRLAPAPVDAVEGGTITGPFLLEDRFTAPASYVGAGTYGFGGQQHSIGHLWFESVRRPPSRGFCAGAGFLFGIEVGDRQARYVSCPEGSETHSGHVLLVWPEAGATHLVSLHGHTAVNRRLDFVLVRSSRIVRP